MTVPSSAQQPETSTAQAERGKFRPASSAVVVALIATLAVAATIVYLVIRSDNQPATTPAQVQQVAELAVAVPPASMAIAPIEEAQRFSSEWFAWQKASLAAAPATEWATYTDRYWALAEQSGVSFPSTANRYYAYYTERYWNLAEAHARASKPAGAVLPAAEQEYAYYTERYWKMAESSRAATVAPEEEWSYYTERYWALSKEKDE